MALVLPDWVRSPNPPGGLLALPDGPHAAGTVATHLALTGDLSAWRVLTGWLVGDPPKWLAGLERDGGYSVMGGGGSRSAVEDGRLRYLPVRLSQVPKLLAETLRPSVTVVRGRPSGSGFRLSPSAGWATTACRLADKVVVEVDRSLPEISTPEVPGNIALVVESEISASRPTRAVPDEIETRIGSLVAGLLPEGATIQHGPGGIAEAVVAAIELPVRVFSGMVSDSLVGLCARGLLTGEPAVGAYLYGSQELEDLGTSGTIKILGVEDTHNLGRVMGIDRFVAVNTAIQVGLDGSINVESVGARSIAGIGGHPDYALAAAASAGGLSIVALRATTSEGHSTIVRAVERVSTSPTDIDVVVTEHGVADLRGLDRQRRAEALVSVADPRYRAALLTGQAV